MRSAVADWTGLTVTLPEVATLAADRRNRSTDGSIVGSSRLRTEHDTQMMRQTARQTDRNPAPHRGLLYEQWQ